MAERAGEPSSYRREAGRAREHPLASSSGLGPICAERPPAPLLASPSSTPSYSAASPGPNGTDSEGL